jgi:hypothetical protein
MKVLHTYIVEYSGSYAEGELAILFECEHRVYYIKYDNLNFETLRRIDREIAESLIK